MSNQDFDEFIKGKLKDLTEQKSESDWYAFSELLKKEDAFAGLDLKDKGDKDAGLKTDNEIDTQKNKEFDNQISEKINSHETNYKETHWEVLRARLEKEEHLRKNLYRTKFIEVAAILLLFLTFSSFYNLDFDTTSKADQSMFAHLYDKAKSSINLEENISKVVATINQVIDKITPSTADEGLFIEKNTSQINFNSQQMLAVNDSRSVEPLNILVSSNIIKEQNAKLLDRKENVSKPGEIDTYLQSITKERLKLYFPEKIANVKASLITKFELGVYISQGIVGVNSEYDYVYNMQGPTTIMSNTNFGFTLAAGTDNLKIFAGIEKSTRTYTPLIVNETYGSADTGYKVISLTSISQNALRIPLGVKYTPFISANRKHKISALINVGGNIITSANYNISNVRLAPSIRPDQNPSSSRSNREEPLLFQKSFENGASNDGLVLENFYLDGGLDLAYERRLTKKIDLSAGISYAKFLTGARIGPNRDSYDQYHFKFGINYTL